MQPEVRRLHPWSWPFIAAGTVRALIFPAVGAVGASGGVLLGRLDLLSLLFVVPAVVYAFIRQRVYSYRFTETELVVRDGLLTRNVRQISYERIHNVAVVRNPFHRMLGVATVRVETAAGGKPEALLRVLSLAAVDELRRYTLPETRKSAATDTAETAAADEPLLQVPDRELVRLGLISNRGLVVVAALVGVTSQTNWWDKDWIQDQNWSRVYESVRSAAPGWATGLLLGIALVVLFLVVVRLLSAAFVGGATGAIAAMHGPPLIILYQHERPEKVRATMAGVFLFGCFLALASLWLAGLMGWEDIWRGLVFLPGVALGFFVGKALAGRMSPTVVRYAMLTISGAAGLMLLAKSL